LAVKWYSCLNFRPKAAVAKKKKKKRRRRRMVIVKDLEHCY
jgi:hypothetical protein